MKNFFPMSRGDFFFIAALLLIALVSFLPGTRATEWAGMSMLGWMMAGLMVLSPTIALARLVVEGKKSATTSTPSDTTTSAEDES